ncbi:hypothetical protein GO988_14690 [Hymenobacter sp. HMF4947]|uniref:Uncharacterized protein n=1 Tax=Hymenobacter ginkgonis TaxID=2682976 RepID=A0A7K1TGR5_9BACT|nr:hypothetical protein [Hymenobacter ginkgonis]MVN77579.1 hypothetical protein [Hymenobacter ginkgonis]
MKRLRFACGLLLLPLLLLEQNGHQSTSFTVSESETTYILLATCDAAPPAQLQYLNDQLHPVPALLATQRLPTHLWLRNQTDLLVQAAPGDLCLTINKETNSAAAVERIQQLVPALKRLALAISRGRRLLATILYAATY